MAMEKNIINLFGITDWLPIRVMMASSPMEEQQETLLRCLQPDRQKLITISGKKAYTIISGPGIMISEQAHYSIGRNVKNHGTGKQFNCKGTCRFRIQNENRYAHEE